MRTVEPERTWGVGEYAAGFIVGKEQPTDTLPIYFRDKEQAHRAANYLNALECQVAEQREQLRFYDCGLGDFGHEVGEPCKNGPYPKSCITCRLVTIAEHLNKETI